MTWCKSEHTVLVQKLRSGNCENKSAIFITHYFKALCCYFDLITCSELCTSGSTYVSQEQESEGTAHTQTQTIKDGEKIPGLTNFVERHYKCKRFYKGIIYMCMCKEDIEQRVD